MSVPFANIPSNLRVPLFYAELDPSRANTAPFTQRALIVGQKTSGGSFAANVPVPLTSLDAVRAGAGAGSMLYLMACAYRASDPFGEVWLLPLDDDGSTGVAATGTIAYTGPSTAAGVISLYVGGKLVQVSIASGTSATNVGVAVRDAVNAQSDLPVTATAATGTVTFTARNKGVCGNDIDLRHNYLGSPAGEVLPAGVGAVITAMANGAVNPTLTTGLANLQDEPFDLIVSPYTDSTSLAALKAFLGDTAGRWSWQTQVYGHVFMAYRETSANLLTFGGGRNDQHATILGVYDVPTPTWLIAADMAGAAAASLRNDPGRPLQTLALNTMKAPPLASRFNLSTRNSLLYKGISTYTVDRDGTVRIENLITTYQTNANGQADNSYLQVETLFTLMLVLRRLRAVVASKYSRVKLAANGTRLNPGVAVVTPNIVRADLIAAYRQMEGEGLVQGAAAFAAALIVEINASNPSRLDVLYPANLVGGLRVFALLAQFSLAA